MYRFKLIGIAELDQQPLQDSQFLAREMLLGAAEPPQDESYTYTNERLPGLIVLGGAVGAASR
ncbi:hypothetical protein SAMN06296416_1054 [Pseudoxanthomonas wuyuanensis]|uniref:Uncharacterized protein n=1 Tax=Pseudoxanthomonas wuyuanensis TaxID=1073196 RepID=A0A286D7Z3_9GAMM|nr:hypothetical protein CSC75_12600 [Pseudoxanthomonas wuyuanensis]SOD54744.1 hypothetical protein SAMN06296416_1054 [Pseudoxanthomonas wuyuanensis]